MTIKGFVDALATRRQEIFRRLEELEQIKHERGGLTRPQSNERIKLNKELDALSKAAERATRERTDGL